MRFRFCPQCAAPLARGPVAGREREHCPGCGYVAFHNPAPVGLAVIEHQEKLVLIRRTVAPLAGYWAPPSGYVELGESVPEAVVREAREECGLVIAIGRLLGVYSHPEVNAVLVAYRARSVGGLLRAGDDASQVALFSPGELPRQTLPQGASPTERWFLPLIEAVLTA